MNYQVRLTPKVPERDVKARASCNPSGRPAAKDVPTDLSVIIEEAAGRSDFLGNATQSLRKVPNSQPWLS